MKNIFIHFYVLNNNKVALKKVKNSWLNLKLVHTHIIKTFKYLFIRLCVIWWNKITRPKKFWDFWCLFYFAMNVKYKNVCNLHILFSKYFLQRITSNNMEQKRVGKGKIYFAKTVFVCPANDNKNSKEPYSSKCKNGVCWLATLKHFIFLL